MPSVADINTKVQAAVSAHESGDYTTAITYLRSAKILLAGIPDATGEKSGLTWDRAAIDSMIQDLKQLQNASATSGGIRRTKIKYVRVDSDDEDCG